MARVARGRARIDMAVPAGEYALRHRPRRERQQRDGHDLGGDPKEGIRGLEQHQGRLGPPKYRDAKFSVGADGAIQRIVIVYF